ncbi:MAG: hypothetical protein RL238_1184 [Actinomycetota bacterium]
MNTFEAPPRDARVATIPPPFVPKLPPQVKVTSVATMPSPGLPGAPPTAAATGPKVQGVPMHLLFNNDSAPPPKRRKKKGSFAKKFLGLLVVSGLAAGGVMLYQRLRPFDAPHPDAWDPRVAELVTFVEQTRALTFEHPIAIDFLSEEQFLAQTRADATAISPDETQMAEYTSELFDAFGLATGYDPSAGQSTLSAATTLGFYSPETDRITVRGNELTPGVRVTVVHELTHALQAQHFDLHDKAGDVPMRSIVEADAMRIEEAYFATLPPEEQAAARAADTMSAEAAGQLATVPWPVVEFQYAPYVLGPALLRTVLDRRGNAGVDDLLSNPPTEEQLIANWQWRPDGDEPSVGITAVGPQGADVIADSTPLSMLEMVVMLDAWLPWTLARSALDHWQAAAYTSYRKAPGGPLCVSVSTALEGDPSTFIAAITWWSTTIGSPTRPFERDGTVTFEVCARGATGANPPLPVVQPTTAMLLENAAVPPTANDLAAASTHLCAARTVIDDPAVAPFLTMLRSPQQQAQVDAALAAARAACGG